MAWWQYALGQPAATNPLTDRTGANCAAGQSGSVFFLSGVAGSGVVNRRCTVPAQSELFFPLMNAFDVHTPGDGLDTPDAVYRDFLSFGFSANTLFASVDGVPMANLDPTTTPFRACSAPVAGCFPSSFSLTLPDNNLFGIAAGTYTPAVQYGYYLRRAPLTEGVHQVKIGGSGTFGHDRQGRPIATRQDITYQLTVVG